MAEVANVYLGGSRLPLLLQLPIRGVYRGEYTQSPLGNTALVGLLVVMLSTLFTLCCTSCDVWGAVGNIALSALNTDSFCVGGGRNTTTQHLANVINFSSSASRAESEKFLKKPLARNDLVWDLGCESDRVERSFPTCVDEDNRDFKN